MDHKHWLAKFLFYFIAKKIVNRILGRNIPRQGGLKHNQKQQKTILLIYHFNSVRSKNKIIFVKIMIWMFVILVIIES